MRLKISLMAIAIGGLALATSCNKYLDEIPDNRTEISDANAISKLLVNAYPAVTPAMALEFMSDNYTDNGRQYTISSNLMEQYYRFRNVITEINQDSPNQYWSAYYDAISHANIALEAIEALGGGAEYDTYKGEALVCRAYSHFMLANIFCDAYNSQFANGAMGVPYATASEREVFVAYERGTLEQTYQNIVRDLEEGLPLLDDSRYAQPKYHFTIAAANAFAAELYLFYSMHDDPAIREERLRKVITHATNAISGDMFRDLSGYPETSDADMMTQLWVSSAEPANLLITTAISSWGRVHPYTTRISLNYTLVNNELMTAGGPWGNSRLSGFNGTVYGVSFMNYFFPKSMEFFTYTNVSAGIGFIRAASTPLTKEKALLARAEAYALLGDYAAATADLNRWYTIWDLGPVNLSTTNILNYYKDLAVPGNKRTINAAGTNYITSDPDKLAMLHAVLHARRLETVHEGNRIFDLRRYAMAYDHIWDGGETYSLSTVERDEQGNLVEGSFNPALKAHDPRLTLQLPAMVISKAPTWENPR